jgi:hypothetical protein
LSAGTGVSLTGDNTAKSVTIGLNAATQSAQGALSSTDKTKLDGIATGAEVNQNTFGTVTAGGTSVASASKTGTLALSAGNGVTLTGDNVGKSVTIAVPNATQSVAGAMSSTDKTKLDGIATGAEVNQNTFGSVTAGGVTVASASKTGTLALTAGNAVTLTGDNTGKAVTIAVPNATQSVAGAMSAADKAKLDGTTAGAQLNQNAFSTVTAGGATIVADSPTDTLTITTGTGIAITGDATNDGLTIAVDATIETKTGAQAKADAVQTNLTNHIGTGGTAHAAVVSGGANGFMTGTDKSKLDGIATGAEVNQNAFSTVTAGSTTLAADSKTDTLTVSGGTGITVTGNATTDTMTIAVDSTIETTTGAQSKADAAQTAAQNWAKGYGLGDVAKNIASTDLNALDMTGFYLGNNLTNAPGGSTGYFFIINMKYSATFATQQAFRFGSGSTGAGGNYIRQMNAGTWSAWEAQANTDVVTTTTNGLMIAADKSKLDGVAAGATNYTHPATHPPSIIVQDASNRFTTDTEKATWNAKAPTTAVTTTTNGLMIAADKSKLDGIAAGAEVNQNTFATIAVSGQSNVVADSKTDTLTLAGGTNVTLTTDATNDKITIDLSSNVQQFPLTDASGKSVLYTGSLDDLKTPGFYYSGSSTTFKPLSAADGTGGLIGLVTVYQIATSAYLQIYTTTTNRTFQRYFNGTSWNGWVELADTDAVTTSANGLMIASDKSKLDGIATGAEVNQNTFSTITAGGVSVASASKTGTLAFTAGNAVTLTGDNTGKAVTIAVPNATQSVAGALSSTDKTKLDGIATGAEVNQNAFATVVAGGVSLVADAESDTLTVNAGAGVVITGTASSDSFTINADLAGSGVASTVARSDHNHDTTYVKKTGDTITGSLDVATALTQAGKPIATIAGGTSGIVYGMQYGSVSAVAGTGTKSVAVTFPIVFAATPVIFVQHWSLAGVFSNWYVYNGATNGFTLYHLGLSSVDLTGTSFRWFAVGQL